MMFHGTTDDETDLAESQTVSIKYQGKGNFRVNLRQLSLRQPSAFRKTLGEPGLVYFQYCFVCFWSL